MHQPIKYQKAETSARPTREDEHDPHTPGQGTEPGPQAGTAEREADWRARHGARTPAEGQRETSSGAERDVEAGESPE